MTQEQKDKLEQLADKFAPIANECYEGNAGFKAGAQTILDNPQDWGLVESNVMETCRKLRLRITEHESENQRLREALEAELNDVKFRFKTAIQGLRSANEIIKKLNNEA